MNAVPAESQRYCKGCNCPRTGEKCWKCGSETFAPAREWEHPALPDVAPIRALAKEKGYALAVHGSLERDLDLIAVPWIEEASSVDELLEHLCSNLIHNGQPARLCSRTETKPHGRIAVNIQLNGWFRTIDLSVTPAVRRKGDVDVSRE